MDEISIGHGIHDRHARGQWHSNGMMSLLGGAANVPGEKLSLPIVSGECVVYVRKIGIAMDGSRWECVGFAV